MKLKEIVLGGVLLLGTAGCTAQRAIEYDPVRDSYEQLFKMDMGEMGRHAQDDASSEDKYSEQQK